MASTIKKDYFWNTLGVFLQNALSPLLLIVVTRINGIDDSGIFSYAFSVAIIFWAIAMWGGRTYQVSDTTKRFQVQSYIAVRLILGILVLISALIFCISNGYDVEKSSIIVTLVCVKIIESIADSIYGVLQTNDRLYVAGRSLMYKSIGGLALFLIINALSQDIFLSCLGLVIVNAMLVVAYDIPAVQKLQNIVPLRGEVKVYMIESFEIMRQTLAVCMVSFLAAFSLNIPRYYLDLSHPDQIGYFGIIAMPVTLVVLVITFILQPNIVNLSRQLKIKEYTQFNKTVNRIMAVTFLVGLVVTILTYMVGVQLLDIIFGLNFSAYKTALMTIIIGASSSALVAILINMLTIMRKLWIQAFVLFISNFFLVLVYIFFAKNSDIVGSVIMFTITATVQALVFYMVYFYEIRKLRNEKT